MQVPLIILSVLVVLGILGIYVYDLKTKKYDVLSMRNIFLLGFAHFFGVGTYFTVVTGVGSEGYVAGDKGIARLFVTTIVFVGTFAVAQRIGQRWTGLRRVVPRVEFPITKLGINIAILALLFTALVCSVIPNLGYAAAVLTQFRGGTAAAAMALATYNLLARKFNPIAWLVFFATLGCTLLLSTVGDIGRRAMLGVVLAIAWIWFYFSLRDRPPAATVVKLGVLLTCGLLMLLVYAGFRSKGFGEDTARRGYSLSTRFQQFSEAVTNPEVKSHSVQAAFMSDTATNSMFIMENYPEVYDYMPLHGFMFVVTNPVPRSFWPEKPRGLGVILQEQLQTYANLGVGIIGHGWAEGGMYGVIGYAVFFGLLTAALDNLIRQRVWNPFFMAAIGSSLGNVCALPRGETSLFFLQIMLSFFGVFIVLYPLKFLLGPLLATSSPLLTDSNRPYFEPPADDAEDRADSYPSGSYGAGGEHQNEQHGASDGSYSSGSFRGAVSP